MKIALNNNEEGFLPNVSPIAVREAQHKVHLCYPNRPNILILSVLAMWGCLLGR